MSAPAPATGPALVESTRRHSQQPQQMQQHAQQLGVASPSTGAGPHRARSTNTRPSTGPPPSTPHRSQSHSHAHGKTPSTAPAHGNIANVARRDFEQSNVAQPPRSASRRSSSREPTEQASHSEHARSHHRTSSHARHTSDASAMASSDGRSGHGAPVKRRTTIGAPTGQWALGKTIGAGSMGKVKLARNAESGEQVAVKIVPRQSSPDEHRNPQDRERADHSKEVRTAREAAIVSLVNHPYICGMRDVVRTNYHWYMLFEYVNGGQMLDYIISHGRLKEKQARKFGRQIASALDYCHRNSIVHRDLKIENILISKTGDIKIIDFGLSNLFQPKSHLKTFCGSLYFAAPELLQARQYTGPEVDIWSFGIVLYVLVCGKVPFDDQSMPQLHAKIKKGNAEYPPWLSAECKNLISRMLVTDPRQRASLTEIMNHPWITKGFNAPPENFLPHREPLQLPLDSAIVEKMTGFDFGSPDYITSKLTRVLESEEYQQAVRASSRKNTVQTPDVERKRGVFDFYKRRNSSTSRDTLVNPSAVEIVPYAGDPIVAFDPLLSIYYLVREKQERERAEENPGALSMPKVSGDKPFQMPDLPAPQAAYTNSATYEMAGEKPTGGRSRPRARTQGEDENTEKLHLNLNSPGPISPPITTPPGEQAPAKKESTAAGILRRFSTRRHREAPKDTANPPPTPSLAVSTPEGTAAPPRKSFSVRRTREKDVASPAHLHPTDKPQQPDMLSPPPKEGTSRRLKGLGRSTSVNSADLRRRMTGRRGASEVTARDGPQTSGSDRSSINLQRGDVDAASDDLHGSSRTRVPASRAKSLGHARRESIQARRLRRERAMEANVPEETDAEANEESKAEMGGESMKPVYLKGLFSVSTTSSRPLSFIRSDIIRVLKQLGVHYHEIRGGFSCRHAPSIDLNKVVDSPSTPAPPSAGLSHRRKISFGGLMGGEKDRDEFREQARQPQTPRSSARVRPSVTDQSFTNTDESDASVEKVESGKPRPRPAGETTTHVQSDLGGSMILKFEIFIVKVPLLSLHGIQFKKVDGGTWQYKSLAQKILDELKL